MTKKNEFSEYSLTYRKWDDYYSSQNRFGDEIQKIQSQIYQNKSLIFNYFSLIESLIDRNVPYIDDFDTKKLKMREIKEKIFSQPFIEKLKRENNEFRVLKQLPLPDEEYLEFIDTLREILREINNDFSKRGISPKAETVPQKESKAEENTKIKEYLRGLEILNFE